ncbi:MAG: hypothetical protein RSA17_10145, partial [Ruthenibacterium sp.]
MPCALVTAALFLFYLDSARILGKRMGRRAAPVRAAQTCKASTRHQNRRRALRRAAGLQRAGPARTAQRHTRRLFPLPPGARSAAKQNSNEELDTLGKYIVKRLALALLTVFVVATLTFFLMNAVPGGPFTAEKSISAKAISALNEKFGLD